MLWEFWWPPVSSAAVLAVALLVIRVWVVRRIEAGIDYTYQTRFEGFKASLQEENTRSLIGFRKQLEQHETLVAYARDSAAHGHRAVMERRLDGIQQLWNSFLSLNQDLPAAVDYIDLLTRDEYRKRDFRGSGTRLLSNLSMESIDALSAKHGQVSGFLSGEKAGSTDYSVERVRPLVGEYMWTVFASYRLLAFRVLFLLHQSTEDKNVVVWYEDSHILEILTALLDQREMDEFDNLRFGHFFWMRNRLERKLLLSIQKTLSGETSGEQAIQQAMSIQEQLRPGTWQTPTE